MPIQKSFAVLLFFYAALVCLLGIMGYRAAGSTASLYSGLFFGMVSLVGSALMLIERPLGCYLGLCSSLILGIFFSLRFQKTLQFMPASIALLSLMVFCMMSYETYQINRRS
ncbi:MAG: TMEM14 family protein [Chlamydiota bacterium]